MDKYEINSQSIIDLSLKVIKRKKNWKNLIYYS
jgi:hypothetical protein